MDPIVNYYVQGNLSIGAAIPLVLCFPNRVMLYLSGRPISTTELEDTSDDGILTISNSGKQFGLEPGTPVFCKVAEIKRYMEWWAHGKSRTGRSYTYGDRMCGDGAATDSNPGLK